MSTLTAPAPQAHAASNNGEKPINLFQLGCLFVNRASYWSCRIGNEAEDFHPRHGGVRAGDNPITAELEGHDLDFNASPLRNGDGGEPFVALHRACLSGRFSYLMESTAASYGWSPPGIRRS